MNNGDTQLTRRRAMARMAAVAAASGLPFGFDAASAQMSATRGIAPWVNPKLPAIKAAGYGQDPNLLHPTVAPWPNTLTEPQLRLVGVLADIILPAQGDIPAATGVGVPAIMDEWVSAPYPMQRGHRQLLLAGLKWLDAEATRRFGAGFVKLKDQQQLQIVDAIAGPTTPGQPANNDLTQAKQFFDAFRRLAAGAFYTSPEGTQELGYQGNVAIAGDYPGPSKAAMRHLNQQLEQLGLSLPPMAK